MARRSLLLFLLIASMASFAQNRTFAFSQIQVRNDKQQWGSAQCVGNRTASFSPTNIDVQVDRPYHLNIVSHTDLPDNGVIYICKDEKANPITVMLIDNAKMFLYSQTKRFLINFNPIAMRYVADSD